ncbi:hypothetical protein CLOSTMETH_01808 [[Clostridium] methylpentosum DSM 5476]|uniref:Uncharacterized protein n=1 Tax=[Clostridium] methylpentosum DSM 5476 TaxID=537013 RepID=C0ED82_9FIRM|nr:hypothetical protein CLOSTMETH_01808 [[Clostridium] methylpentosum DSM 5476]MEE1490606.1 toxin-antitoxin system HicB family antitoxin [Massilioclostridium sp.]
MSKKSFRENNPALQFITPAPVPEAPAVQPSPAKEKQTDYTDYTHNTSSTQDTQNTENISKKQETKSKRLNLLIQPSLHQELTKIAYVQRVSLNELILRASREYAAAHQDAVRKYDEFTGE